MFRVLLLLLLPLASVVYLFVICETFQWHNKLIRCRTQRRAGLNVKLIISFNKKSLCLLFYVIRLQHSQTSSLNEIINSTHSVSALQSSKESFRPTNRQTGGLEQTERKIRNKGELFYTFRGQTDLKKGKYLYTFATYLFSQVEEDQSSLDVRK